MCVIKYVYPTFQKKKTRATFLQSKAILLTTSNYDVCCQMKYNNENISIVAHKIKSFLELTARLFLM